MKFTKLDAIEALGKKEAVSLMILMHTHKDILNPTERTVYRPIKSRVGKDTTMRVELSVYDAEKVISIYENKMLLPTHKHLVNKYKVILKRLYKLSSHLDLVAS